MDAVRAQFSLNDSDRGWKFASAEFNEQDRRLIVDGRVVPIEAKPMALLVLLLERAGKIVTKDEMLDRVWPDIFVVEASLSTAVSKLRRALGDDGIIETIPRVGYRLTVPVEQIDQSASRDGKLQSASNSKARPGSGPSLSPRSSMVAAVLALVIIAGTLVAFGWQREARAYSQADAKDAIRELDVDRVRQMLRQGWNPNTPFDKEGNTPLSLLVETCEWNPSHDRGRLMLMARTLVDGGAQFSQRNVWGDTPYSIAKAPRFCGPDHPVTKMLHRLCFNGYQAPGDDCLATYELGQAS